MALSYFLPDPETEENYRRLERVLEELYQILSVLHGGADFNFRRHSTSPNSGPTPMSYATEFNHARTSHRQNRTEQENVPIQGSDRLFSNNGPSTSTYVAATCQTVQQESSVSTGRKPSPQSTGQNGHNISLQLEMNSDAIHVVPPRTL